MKNIVSRSRPSPRLAGVYCILNIYKYTCVYVYVCVRACVFTIYFWTSLINKMLFFLLYSVFFTSHLVNKNRENFLIFVWMQQIEEN